MEWISVKDELPDPYVEVLTWPKRDQRYGSDITGYYSSKDELFYVDCEDSNQCYEDEIHVTHWRYLPEPPKEK